VEATGFSGHTAVRRKTQGGKKKNENMRLCNTTKWDEGIKCGAGRKNRGDDRGEHFDKSIASLKGNAKKRGGAQRKKKNMTKRGGQQQGPNSRAKGRQSNAKRGLAKIKRGGTEKKNIDEKHKVEKGANRSKGEVGAKKEKKGLENKRRKNGNNQKTQPEKFHL